VICPEPLLNGWQRVNATGGLQVGYQGRQFRPHLHQPHSGVRAIQIMVDLIAHDHLNARHPGPQGADPAADLINSVIHGLLEQKENI
jgi:hypothetical protein